MLLRRELYAGSNAGGRSRKEGVRDQKSWRRLCQCNALEAATVDALRELGMDMTIDHVRDFEKIAAYGVMTTPALVVDGQVVSYGKVLKKDEVIVILKKVRA